MIKYYNTRVPNDSDGIDGDIAVVNTGRAIFLYVKAKRQWYQTQQLEPKNWSLSNIRKMNGFFLMSDIILNGKYISGSGTLQRGLTINKGTDQVFVNTTAGLKVSANIYLKGNHGKIYFDGENGDDYIIGGVSSINLYSGGEGILKIQNSTSDGIVIPIGKKIMFSNKNLGDESGDEDDDNFYIYRQGAEGTAGTALDIYTADTQAITISASALDLKPDNYELRFNDGSYYTGFKSHTTMTANAMYTLPAAYPADATNNLLTSNGSGVMAWSSAPVTALNSATENELVTVGATTTELDAEANLTFDGTGLKIKEAADASADTAGYGQIWVDTNTPNILMFTDDDGQDIHLTKNTAVWGGGFARTTGANGKWLGIPTGHQGGVLSFGTNITAPDTTLDPDSYADDLGAVIWQSIHSIRVTACKIWYGQGGSTNTRHSVCLMRYDINIDGDLSNGVEVAGVDNDGGSDDYDTLARTSLTMTSDDTVSTLQVLVAMVYLKDASNAAMTAKCILEYQDLP